MKVFLFKIIKRKIYYLLCFVKPIHVSAFFLKVLIIITLNC